MRTTAIANSRFRISIRPMPIPLAPSLFSNRISLVLTLFSLLFFIGCSQRSATLDTVKRARNDQDLLGHIASDATDVNVRLAAVEKISDLNWLDSIAWRNDVPEVKQKAANRLAQIKVRKIQDEDECMSFVSGITSQGILENIALNEGCLTCGRVMAVSKITNQDFLDKIALNDECPESVRISAINTNTSQSVLHRIPLAKESENQKYIPPYLRHLVTNKERQAVRLYAVDKIEDQDVLLQIAINAPHYRDVRVAAFSKLDVPRMSRAVTECKDCIERLECFEVAFNKASKTTDSFPPGILQLIPALSSIPDKKHGKSVRSDCIPVFLSIAHAFSNPGIVERLGRITSIRLSWKETWQDYIGVRAYGESISVSFSFENMPEKIEGSWETKFEGGYYISESEKAKGEIFVGAVINPRNLFDSPCLAGIKAKLWVSYNESKKEGLF